MKNKISKILVISLVLTTIGFLMDGDIKEPSMLMRFVEYFGIAGIFFTMIYIFYFSAIFAVRKFQKVLN